MTSTGLPPPQRKLSSNLMQMAFMNRNNNTTINTNASSDAIAKRARTVAAAESSAAATTTKAANSNAIESNQSEKKSQIDHEDEWVVPDLLRFSHVRPKRSIQAHSNLLSPLASDSVFVAAGRRSVGVPEPPQLPIQPAGKSVGLSAKKRPLSSVSAGFHKRRGGDHDDEDVHDDRDDGSESGEVSQSSSGSDSVHTVNVHSTEKNRLPQSFGGRRSAAAAAATVGRGRKQSNR
jgi:hypothetical protein